MDEGRLPADALPVRTRSAVEALTGPIHAVTPVDGGHHSDLAVRVDTATGPVFVKGLRTGDPRAAAQRREALIGECVAGVGPGVLWRLLVGGWDLVGFEFVAGRHADYRERSGDLVLLAEALKVLAGVSLPAVELPSAGERWAGCAPGVGLGEALVGSTLCHTDFNPENVLVTADGAVLVDWGWAVRGPAWLDPALVVVRLIATGGQSPAAAQAWAARLPAWRGVPDGVIGDFVEAEARYWEAVTSRTPAPWSRALADAARAWAGYRAR